MEKQLQQLLDKQRTYYNRGFTKDIEFRIEQLALLKKALIAYEARLLGAIGDDLGKSEHEILMTEIYPVYQEIDRFIKRLKTWTKAHKVERSKFFEGTAYEVVKVPRGVILILSSWSMPVRTALLPLVAAVGSGNCIVLKPSGAAEKTSTVLKEITEDFFSHDHIKVVEGGDDLAVTLALLRFDMIHMTGSRTLVKTITRSAVEFLTPVVSVIENINPCIVDKNADVQAAAKRIIWSKTLSAGQSHMAPSQIHVHESIKESLVDAMIKAIEMFYGTDPICHADYPRIVDLEHFEKMLPLLQNGQIRYGGSVDGDMLKISPTLITDVDWQSPIMKDVIAGPILPIMGYESLTEVMAEIERQPKPLALYLFTEDEEIRSLVMERLTYDIGYINDMSYHPITGGFDDFTRVRHTFEKKSGIDSPWKYPPYGIAKRAMLKRL